VGHLRNLILGDALANIYESAGWDVTRWNYIGDWGTQFGKLIFAYRRWGDKEQVEKNPISELTSLYVRFHQEAEYDKTLEEGARLEFKKLETGDEENRTMWQWFKELSLKDMQDLLNRVMASPFDVEQGEAFYENDLDGVIAEVVSAGITKESEGALVIPLPDKELPAMIRKSDGASLYLTRDIANLKYRLKEFTPAEILYVIGNEQSLQFEQFFTVAGMLGLDRQAQLFHIKYGLVLSADGKKFSTRKGDTVLASDILDEAETRALKVVKEKRGDLEDFQQKEIAKDIALSAVKYAMLKDGRTTDISFDWDRMLDFHGDSGPYLLYTHARLRTMLSKSEDRCLESIPGGLLSEEELALIRQIAEFPSVIEAARSEKSVNKICLYLYELCNGANAWYEGAPVIKDEDKVRRAARLTLGEAIADTLSRGLRILSIPTPERI